MIIILPSVCSIRRTQKRENKTLREDNTIYHCEQNKNV